MRNTVKLLFAGCCIWLAIVAPALAQNGPDEVPESVDQQYVDSIDPYSVGPGDYLAFDYEAYSAQANKAYQAGDYELAAKYYLALIRRNVDDAGAIYDLACCYGRLEMPVPAGLFLEGAFAAGYDDYEWAANDPDFEAVRDDPAFQDAWGRIGELMDERLTGLGELVAVAAPVFLKCRVMLPANYDPAMEYPLLIGLHGYGDNPDNFATLLQRRGIDSSGFIYAAPQGPYPFLPGRKIGYSWIEGQGENEDTWKQARALAIDYVGGVVGELKARYSIGDVYLMGFSQGCTMTYSTGLTYPGLFKGLICFSGWLDSDMFADEQYAAASGLPVFIAQGTSDQMVEPASATTARDTLVKHGFTVKYYEFDGGHTVLADALTAALVYMGLLE